MNRAHHPCPVWAQDAFGNRLRRVAISGVERGGDFSVVWLCREDEWREATGAGRRPVAVPWPAEDVAAIDE